MRAQIYVANINNMDVRKDELEKLLPPLRAKAVHKYKDVQARLRSTVAWLLLEKILAGGKKIHENLLQYGKYGKPRLKGYPHYNLSHAGQYVALAIADTQIGVDIEPWKEGDFLALASVAFHSVEQEQLKLDIGMESYFDTWVLKEAYLKMSGLGLSGDPRSFYTEKMGEKAIIKSDVKAYLQLYKDIPGYSLALCSYSSDIGDELIFVEI